MKKAEELQAAVDAFNALAPLGTRLRICKGAIHHRDAEWVESEVVAPGAYVMGGHSAVVKVPGDSIALTHVEIVPAPPAIRTDFETLKDGARIVLHPRPENPLHRYPIKALYMSGYFYCEGTPAEEGPDYYTGDVLRFNVGFSDDERDAA